MAYRGTPIFTMRLKRETRERLAEVGRIYGARSTSAIVREILEVAVSADAKTIGAFVERFTLALGRQLELPLLPGVRLAKAQPKRIAKQRMKT
jgi:hypothetical protein